MTEEKKENFMQLPLGEMVDMVINSPEEGVVNFNLLHTILHVIVQQLNAKDLNVELHGPEAERLQSIIKVNQEKGNADQAISITQVNADKEQVIVVDTKSSQHASTSITKKQLDKIVEEVTDVKQQLKELIEMPTNLGIIDAVRGTEGGSNVVVDMFQILNLSKRVDAAEIGMNKMASIMEDLIKSPLGDTKSSVCNTKEKSKLSTSARQSKTKLAKVKSSEKEKSSSGTGVAATSPAGSVSQAKISPKSRGKSPAGGETDEELESRLLSLPPDEMLNGIIQELAKLKNLIDYYISGSTEKAGIDESDSSERKIVGLAELSKDVAEIKELLHMNKSHEETADDTGDNANVDLPPKVQLTLLEDRFQDYNEHIQEMDKTFNDEILKLQNQFTDIERDFNEILSKIQNNLPAGDQSMDEPNQCCAALYQKLLKMQTDLDDVAQVSATLNEDRDDKQRILDEMLEQIELLKTIKADREDIEEALADKADACLVHRKVSHDQFDLACDGLSKGIEEALEKLTQQEVMWQQALDSIQNEIGNKLDKMDLGPLREFINNKLKMLQDRMKSLAALKREQEAAGAKSKFLRNVNCISCDKDVVMRKEMDSTLRPQHAGLPPSRSMGPYLAYELDALRKQQKSLPGSKNMNNFTNAMGLVKGVKKDDDHICNRYCGGSHTITTPQQRVTRLGHFLAQWGPEALSPPEAKVSVSVSAKKSVLSAKGSVVMPAASISTPRKSSVSQDKPKSAPILQSSSLTKSSHRTSATKPSSATAVRTSTDAKRVPSTTESKKSRTSVKEATGSKSNVGESESAPPAPRTSQTGKIVEETASQLAVEAEDNVPEPKIPDVPPPSEPSEATEPLPEVAPEAEMTATAEEAPAVESEPSPAPAEEAPPVTEEAVAAPAQEEPAPPASEPEDE